MIPSYIAKHRGKVDMGSPNAFPIPLFVTCWLQVDASYGTWLVRCPGMMQCAVCSVLCN